MLVDDQLIATTTGANQLRVLDPLTLEEVTVIDVTPMTAGVLGNVGDGTIISAGPGGVERIDLATGGVVWQRLGDQMCDSLVITAPPGRLFCGNIYGRLDERDLDSGVVVRELGAQNGNSGRLDLADDGRTLVSFGINEPVVARWRLDGTGPITRLVAHGFDPVAFDASGQLLIVDRGETRTRSRTGSST